MRQYAVKSVLLVAFVASVSACDRGGGGNTVLSNLRQSSIAPDEFLVVPQKPLETPDNLASLPLPAPGQTNRVSIDFEENLLKALGGRGQSSARVPASETALVNAARSQFGTTENIREILQAEDQEFREARRDRIARLARERRAGSIYDFMLLDPLAEVERLREMGVKAPAVPPN